ncbi:MAG: twin-arginine translocase TatA/TatE family subunit [Persicimonas sp.]
MLPGTTELILVIAIAICIFGLGRLGDISRAIGERRAQKARGPGGEDIVDITPVEAGAEDEADEAEQATGKETRREASPAPAVEE